MFCRFPFPSKNVSFFYRNFSTTTKFGISSRRLPVHNGFLLDTRAEGERKVINPNWKSKNGKHLLRIEIIDRKDFDIIAQFFIYQFVKYSNICRCLNLTYDDLEKFFLELLDSFIDKPISYAVFDDKKLVGIKLNNYHTSDEFLNLYPEGLHHSNPKYEIKNDYTQSLFFLHYFYSPCIKVIKSSPYNLKVNHLYGIYTDCLKNTGKFLPSDCKKIGVLEATGIHEKYMGCGLIHYLYALSVKAFADENCDDFASYCFASATYESGKKIGMEEAYSLPYEAVKIDGKTPFHSMHDGATAFRTMIGNVKDSYEIVKNQL